MATSLGSSVGTRVESASRHMLQCRVHKDRYLSWNVDNELLRRNKNQYSMTKDELVVDSSSSLFPARDHVCKQPHPYPRVVTTWRGLDEKLMNVYCFLMAQGLPTYFELLKYLGSFPDKKLASNNDDGRPMFTDRLRKPVFKEFQTALEKLDAAETKKLWHQFHTIPDFRVMGYSVGTAYAHEYNGDTIASVMIGGLVTVQNGRYAMHTGDPVCWYVQYVEEVCFDPDGKRLEDHPSKLLDSLEGAGGIAHVRPTGKQGHAMRNSGFGDTKLKDNIFLPKPFFFENASFGDTRRVFAKCLSNAAPYERVDIMIASQSL
jgi:hypothetical protein